MAQSISAFGETGQEDIRLDSRGNLAVVDGLESVRQRVIHRLLFWLGEWYLDTQRGVDYPNGVFTRPISAGLAATIITDQIRSVADVTGVSQVRAVLDASTRVLTYSATIQTIYGPLAMNMDDNDLSVAA